VATDYKIKDVAERSGFSPATLRYYEEIGLLPRSERTAAGYRVYDERTVERLAFIARAKQLGCTLDEIADLTLAWDGGRCGPVQDRLRTIVADKITTTQRQITELLTLSAELQEAAASLERHRPDGPCDDTCGCVSDGGTAAVVKLGSKPAAVQDDVAIACTLAAPMMRGRLDDWQELLGFVERREAIDAGVRLSFGPAVPLARLTELVVAEQECCQFFGFAITVDRRGVALEVQAPETAQSIVTTLFGAEA